MKKRLFVWNGQNWRDETDFSSTWVENISRLCTHILYGPGDHLSLPNAAAAIIKHSGSHPSDRVQLLPRTKISLFAINPYVAGKWTCHRSSWISFVSRTLGYWHCTGPVHIIILHSPRWLTQNLHIFMAQLRRKRIYARGNGCRAPHVAVLRWEAVHHRFCWDLACFEWVFFISTTHDLGD